jgi:hypothetical protein
MLESMCLVGFDVHQAHTVAAVLDPVSGELRVERLRGAPAGVVLAFLEELGRPVRAIYEAARLRTVRQAAATLGVPRDRAERVHLRHQTRAGRPRDRRWRACVG